MSKSFLRLIKRFAIAARLGFPFHGTSRTRFPKEVAMGGRRVSLATPGDGGYLCDVINLWLDDEYGLRALRPAPRAVVDIGANIGLFSLWAAHNFPNAKIHAYEPNPKVLPSLRANVNQFAVEVFPFGVGRDRCRAEIRDDADSRLAMTRTSSNGEIEIRPFAEVISQCGGAVDLLKMDCEGAEWELFEDAESFRHVAHIRMEYHLVKGHTVDDLKRRARKIGFSLTFLAPNQGFGIAWLERAGR